MRTWPLLKPWLQTAASGKAFRILNDTSFQIQPTSKGGLPSWNTLHNNISIFRSKWKNAVLTFFKGNDYNFTSNKHKYWRRPTAPLLKKGGGLWYYERWKSRGHLRHIQPHHVQCVPLGHVGLVCSSDKGSDIWKTVEGQFNWSTRIDFRFCSCDTRYAIVLTKPWLTPLDSLYV